MTQQDPNQSEGSNATRRNVLKAGFAVSAAAVGISTSGVGLAQSEMDLTLSVDAEAELVTITNNGDSEVDLTGYQMNFEAGEDSNQDQIRTFAGEVLIGAGESVTVATGAGEEGDVSLEDPYERPEINNEDPDVIALLTPDGDVVVTSDGSSGSGSDGYDDTATGIVRVVDQNGDPVEDEPVRLVNVIYEGAVEELTTDENGEVTISLGSSDPSDVVSYDVEVRDQTKRLYLDSDEENGVDEVIFEVDTSDEDDGETHTMTVSVVNQDSEPLEGVGVSAATYDGGVDAGEGTTDENGEVEFELENGSYEFWADHETLYQSSANRLAGIHGEDNTFEIVLAPADEVGDGPDDDDGSSDDEEGDDDDSEEVVDGDEGVEDDADEEDGDDDADDESDESDDSGSETDDDGDDDEEAADNDDDDESDKTDADDDGVAASEDSDDDCAKID